MLLGGAVSASRDGLLDESASKNSPRVPRQSADVVGHKTRQTPAACVNKDLRYQKLITLVVVRKCLVNASVLQAASFAEFGARGGGSPETAAPGYDATPPALARDRITAHFSIGHKSRCAALLLSACLLQPLHCSPPRASRPEDACRRAEDACRRDDTCLQPAATHRHSKRIPSSKWSAWKTPSPRPPSPTNKKRWPKNSGCRGCPLRCQY